MKRKLCTGLQEQNWNGFHSRGNFQDLCGCGDPNNAENTEKWWSRQLLYGLLDLVYETSVSHLCSACVHVCGCVIQVPRSVC